MGGCFRLGNQVPVQTALFCGAPKGVRWGRRRMNGTAVSWASTPPGNRPPPKCEDSQEVRLIERIGAPSRGLFSFRGEDWDLVQGVIQDDREADRLHVRPVAVVQGIARISALYVEVHDPSLRRFRCCDVYLLFDRRTRVIHDLYCEETSATGMSNSLPRLYMKSNSATMRAELTRRWRCMPIGWLSFITSRVIRRLDPLRVLPVRASLPSAICPGAAQPGA